MDALYLLSYEGSTKSPWKYSIKTRAFEVLFASRKINIKKSHRDCGFYKRKIYEMRKLNTRFIFNIVPKCKMVKVFLCNLHLIKIQFTNS